MQRLPELKPTPIRSRHPLVYGAGILLFVSLVAFLGRLGMVWALSAAGLAILMAVIAFIVALRAPGGSA